jgi:hypothetical protein
MDWRAFSKRLLLTDGRIDEPETRLLRRAVLEDGLIGTAEVEFLLDLRREAKTVHPEFTKFLYAVIKAAVLRDGVVGPTESGWLRKMIFEGGRLPARSNRRFLTAIARDATRVSPEFDALLADCGGPAG